MEILINLLRKVLKFDNEKTFIFSFSFYFFILISFLTILSTTGIETKKFNDLISNKIYRK